MISNPGIAGQFDSQSAGGSAITRAVPRLCIMMQASGTLWQPITLLYPKGDEATLACAFRSCAGLMRGGYVDPSSFAQEYMKKAKG